MTEPTFSESALYDHVSEEVADIERGAQWWVDGDVPPDGTTNFLYSVAKEFTALATSAALLGATRQSREWFGEAARFHLEQMEGHRLRRDISAVVDWKNEPQSYGATLSTSGTSSQTIDCFTSTSVPVASSFKRTESYERWSRRGSSSRGGVR